MPSLDDWAPTLAETYRVQLGDLSADEWRKFCGAQARIAFERAQAARNAGMNSIISDAWSRRCDEFLRAKGYRV